VSKPEIKHVVSGEVGTALRKYINTYSAVVRLPSEPPDPPDPQATVIRHYIYSQGTWVFVNISTQNHLDVWGKVLACLLAIRDNANPSLPPFLPSSFFFSLHLWGHGYTLQPFLVQYES
jgi:hypothetical protein